MKLLDRTTSWLETHWVNPAYSGWLMGGLALFFFGAATNTMAGWLYVISGMMLAVLALASALPIRALRGIKLRRSPIAPVSVGESLTLEVWVENSTKQPKALIQLLDLLPAPLPTIRTAVEQIPAQNTYCWRANLPTDQRGIYRWQTVQLRTAAPLGLFWRRQNQNLPAKAVVYPTVLQLAQCPLMDQFRRDDQPINSYSQTKLASEGMTRTLRPYRWGDSTRMIHWRSSARYGELRIRELETNQSGQELVIGLDSEIIWNDACFEQAVVAAASLYFYGIQRQLQVSLWTAGTGLIKGEQTVLETLAAVQFQEHLQINRPQVSLWLTQTPERLADLATGSRWLLWQHPEFDLPTGIPALESYSGIVIQPNQPLQTQLQTP
jgi:uncharacterized protein (DUF58 family)